MSEFLLAVHQLSHTYRDVLTLDQMTFGIRKGTIACLLGPSGSGKTTLLRCIAGFEPIKTGAITLGGRTVSLKGMTVSPEQRRIGFVAQDGNLFPHLNVHENISFGIDHLPTAQRQARIGKLLAAVDLTGRAGHYPDELSAGERGRVAIARALAVEPDLLLLDEPFANLDFARKERLKTLLRSLLKVFGVTALVVTHDPDEAFDLGAEIGVINAGRLLQWGTPQELYRFPKNRLVAEFLGQCAFLPAWINKYGKLQTDLGVVKTSRSPDQLREIPALHVLVRPTDLEVVDLFEPNAEVTQVNFRGTHCVYTLKIVGGQQVHCFAPISTVPQRPGDQLALQLKIREPIFMSGIPS